MHLKALLLIIFSFILSGPLRAQDAAPPLYLLDFVFLNDGMTIDDHSAYNAQAAPIAARYGINLIATLDPLNITDGPDSLARVDIWTLPSQQALVQWGADPEFIAMEPEIARIHDMHNLTLYVAENVLSPDVSPGTAYHLELLTVSQERWNREAFINYILSVDEIAESHGIIRQASLSGLDRLTGDGPTANWFSLYSVPGPDEYSAMAEDPRMTALNDTRYSLFVRENALQGAFLAQ